jgi:hypothetical protein
MKTSRGLPLALAALLLAGFGLAIWQLRSAQAAQARLAEADRQRASLLTQVQKLQSALAQTDAERDRLREPAAVIKKPAAPVAGMDTAEQYQARIRILRAWLALHNGSLYRKLQLTPDQISQLEDLEVSHFQRLQDIVATAQAEKIPFSDPAITQLRKQESQQFQQEEEAALGEPLAQEVQQYDRTAAVRSLTNALAGNSYYSDPLNPQQGDQVTQILANSSAAYNKGQDAGTNDLNFDSALAQVQTVLTPEQFAAAQNLIQGSQAGPKLMQLLTSLTQGAAPVPSTQSTGK